MKRLPPKNGLLNKKENILLVDGNDLYKRGLFKLLNFHICLSNIKHKNMGKKLTTEEFIQKS